MGLNRAGRLMHTVAVSYAVVGAPAPALADSTAEVPMSGRPVPGLEPFDELLLSFMAEHGVPGASVCVSREGAIIYARGFGYADVETKRPVEPDSLFRIASVSKPITAVAIMQLVERERLSLDDNPFAILGQGEVLRDKDVDPRLGDVTIRHLLQHTAGFDRGQSFDPMFQYRRIALEMGVASPPGHQAIIEFMLKQPLDFDPGDRYAYSNFGYCVLGRVIEQASGMTYESFVRERVLEPLGVTAMRIGRSLPEDRADGEVAYYDAKDRTAAPVHDPRRRVPRPYAIDHEVMDSHGAWVASGVDLVKFADSFNDPAASPLLTAGSIATMFAPPPGSAGHDENGRVKSVYYGCGWSVRPVGASANTWHAGRINGTSTILVRRHDGLNWAVLFNADQSRATGQALASLIDPLMHRAAAEVIAWPDPLAIEVPSADDDPMADGGPDFDALWDYSDPAATEAQFREILSGDEHTGDSEYLAQLLTQIARAQGLQRQFDDAHATLDRVEGMLTDQPSVARVRYLMERGRAFNSSGEPDRARPLFVHAWELARKIGLDGHAVDAAHMVAIVESDVAALEWNLKALDLAKSSCDPIARRWLGSLHNNLGWTHHDRGDFETALDHFEQALLARQESSDASGIRIAKWCIGRCFRSLGRTEEALSLQRELEHETSNDAQPDGFVSEEIAECLLILGRVDEAKPYFRRAHEILSSDAWLCEHEPARIDRLKQLATAE